MSVYHIKESGKWRVQLGSKHNRKTKVFATEREALRYEALHKGTGEPVAVVDQTTWADLASDYFKSTLYLDKSENTKPVERRASKPVLAYFGNMLVVETDDLIVDKYKEMRCLTISPRTKKRLAGNTVRLELSFIATLTKLALKNKIIKDSPLRLVEQPKCNEKEIRINPSESSIMWATLSKYELEDEDPEIIQAYRYFYCLFHIGCRPGELAALTYSNVNIDKMQIRFKRTKNTKSRTVPVLSSCWNELRNWALRTDKPPVGECPYVFPTKKRNGEWGPYDFSNSWKKMRKLFGHLINPEITPHAFRHERISQWFETVDLNEGQIMEMSGHLTPVSLNRYRHIRAERFREKLEANVENERKALVAAFEKTYANGVPTQRQVAKDDWGGIE